MKLRILIVLALILIAPPSRSANAVKAGDYSVEAGKFEVETALFSWQDTKRNRNVPAKIYYPKSSGGPFPIVIFSHGLGGTREGYEYLGRAWASHGYVSVHLQHLGSDDSVWRDAPL